MAKSGKAVSTQRNSKKTAAGVAAKKKTVVSTGPIDQNQKENALDKALKNAFHSGVTLSQALRKANSFHKEVKSEKSKRVN